MISETVTIYVGRWNDREFVFSLEREKAKSLVESHFAFGDPSEDEYALGNAWAIGNENCGWRIVECHVTIPVIVVELTTSNRDDTAHIIWQCPYCNKFYSDNWRQDDELPVLVSCGCEEASHYLLAAKGKESEKGKRKESEKGSGLA